MTIPNNVGSSNNRYSIGMPSPRPITPRFSGMDPSMMLPGFYVSSEDEIRPGDVNMDGSISFFPSKDLQKIYIRQWNKNGELERLTYVLANPDPEPQTAPPPQPQYQQGAMSQENAVAQALNNLSAGLSNTFTQFGSVLQSMNQRFERLEQSLPVQNLPASDDGGRG